MRIFLFYFYFIIFFFFFFFFFFLDCDSRDGQPAAPSHMFALLFRFRRTVLLEAYSISTELRDRMTWYVFIRRLQMFFIPLDVCVCVRVCLWEEGRWLNTTVTTSIPALPIFVVVLIYKRPSSLLALIIPPPLPPLPPSDFSS